MTAHGLRARTTAAPADLAAWDVETEATTPEPLDWQERALPPPRDPEKLRQMLAQLPPEGLRAQAVRRLLHVMLADIELAEGPGGGSL